MNISGTTPQDALKGYQSGDTPLDMRVGLLKKANDQVEQQGEQMVEMLEQAGEPIRGGRLDVYA